MCLLFAETIKWKTRRS